MDNFCTECGAKLDEHGRCPKCGCEVLQEQNDKGKNVKKKAKKALVITIIVLSVYAVSLIALSTLVYFDKINIPLINDIFIYMDWKKEKAEELPPIESAVDETQTEESQTEETPDSSDNTEDYEVEVIDADKYLSNNSTVITQIPAADSPNVRTESETYTNIIDRGFNQNPIITNYSMQGEYFDDVQISNYSSEKHPMYQTWYVTPNGVAWQIFEINGAVFASKFSGDMKVGFVVSETDTVTSYDSVTNKFYVNTPKTSIMKITKVARVDAATLDSMN